MIQELQLFLLITIVFTSVVQQPTIAFGIGRKVQTPERLILNPSPRKKITLYYRNMGLSTATSSATPAEDVSKIVAKVSSKADEWKNVPTEKKIDLLKQILENTIKHQGEWNAIAQESRNVDPSDPRHGCARADIIISGVATFGSYINGLISSLEYSLKDNTNDDNNNLPLSPKTVRKTLDGKTIVTLWPNTLLDQLEAVPVFGLKGELVLADGGEDEADTKDHCYQNSFDEVSVGGVSGVLGSGNVDAPIELLCQMFIKDRVCIYKPNPVNQRQHDIIYKILEPLVHPGYLDYVIGGGTDVGTALVTNPVLDEVVLTGSHTTYEKIKPIVAASTSSKTTICAELGGVNPWIIVPGEQWCKRSIDRHARHLAFAKCANNGHTCAAPQIIIVPKDWSYRELFLDRVRFWLGRYAGSPPFYPGSDTVHSAFRQLSNAELIIQVREGDRLADDTFKNQQHPVLIPNASISGSKEKNAYDVFSREAFCPVLAECPIDYSSNSNGNNDDNAMIYLRSALEFVEQHCFGSLSANIIIPDRQVKSKSEEFDNIVGNMKYGVVGINIWPAFAHSLPMLVWGAHPGNEQSGKGFIGNAYLYKHPQKTVLRAPFNWLGLRALSIMPPRKTEKVFRRLAQYKLRPNVLTQTLFFTALFFGV